MINIIAVDDDPAYLDKLSTKVFLPSDQDFRLIHCINHMEDEYNVEFMLKKIKDLKPHVVLMDLSFAMVGRPHDYGIELVKKILEKFPEQKIIMLVADHEFSDPDRTDKIFRSFQAGASAYVGKREDANFRQAINEVINGDRYISEKTSRLLINGIKPETDEARRKYKLTDRHLEVLLHLSHDKDINQVASCMMNEKGNPLNYFTVVFHINTIRTRLMGKEGTGTLQGIVAKALREKLID